MNTRNLLGNFHSTTIENIFDELKPAEILFKAIHTYNDISGMFSSSAFKVLMKLLTMASYEDFKEPVIVSLHTLERHLGLDRKTVLTALKELMAKRFIIQVSGKYEKKTAIILKKHKFLERAPIKNYNEVNAYIVEPAIEIGYSIYLWKKLARSFKFPGISVDTIREFVLLTSAVQNNLLPVKPNHTSIRSLKEKLTECPDFFETLAKILENATSLQQLKKFLQKVKLSNKDIQKFFHHLNLDDKYLVEKFLISLGEFFHFVKLADKNLVEKFPIPYGEKFPIPYGEKFPIYSLPSNALPPHTHTQGQLKKSECQEISEFNLTKIETNTEPLKLDNLKLDNGNQENKLDNKNQEHSAKEIDIKPDKQKRDLDIPYEVIKVLIEYLEKKDEIKNPIGIIKTASEIELNLLAEDVLKENFKEDFEIEVLLKDYKLKPIKVLEYVLLTEEGKLDFLVKHNINIEEFAEKVEKVRQKRYEEIKNYIWQKIEEEYINGSGEFTEIEIEIKNPIYQTVLEELEREGHIKIIRKTGNFWKFKKLKSKIAHKLELLPFPLVEFNRKALLLYLLIEKHKGNLTKVKEEIRQRGLDKNPYFAKIWNTLKSKGILRVNKKEDKIEIIF